MTTTTDRMFQRTVAEVLSSFEKTAAGMLSPSDGRVNSPRLTWERVCKQHVNGGELDGSVVIVMTLRGNRVGRIFRVATLVFQCCGAQIDSLLQMCMDEYVDTFLRHFNAAKQPAKLHAAYLGLCGFSQRGAYGVMVI